MLTTGGIPAQVQTEIKRLWFTNKSLAGSTLLTGTNYLQDGYNVCIDPVNTCHTDGTSTAQTGYGVTKPETRNLAAYAGVVANVPPNFQGPGWVDVIVKSSGQIPVWTLSDLSSGAGTPPAMETRLLMPVNAQWYLSDLSAMTPDAAGNTTARKSVALCYTNQTDTSSTAGLNNVHILPTCAL